MEKSKKIQKAGDNVKQYQIETLNVNVTPEDVKLLALPVFRKRIILTSDSLLKGYKADTIINDLIEQVPLPAFRAHV